ncbi:MULTISPECIES: hypothetical protein [Pseudomonas]|uniref:hypothetical protein n=1 Tax=Pseudomonas TaxID=286 RepID=UPI00235F8C83|nr:MULTISPECIES: hypothetical protein [Pseudomonas]WJV23176.1 hypothetical protein PSR66_26650 [Pseudomonas chlororaphis]
MSRERYLFSASGDNKERTTQGLAKFFELCAEHGSGVIVVPVIGKVDSTLFTKVLKPELAKALIKNRTVTFGAGKTITLCSSTTLNKHTGAKVYLTLWCSEKVIYEIEKSCYSCVAEVFVTWAPEDADAWTKAYEVTSI